MKVVVFLTYKQIICLISILRGVKGQSRTRLADKLTGVLRNLSGGNRKNEVILTKVQLLLATRATGNCLCGPMEQRILDALVLAERSLLHAESVKLS